MTTTYDRLHPQSKRAARVETLFGQYPHLNEQELIELLRLYPYLSMLDYSLIPADERLSKNLAELYRAQSDPIETDRRFVGLLALPATVTILALLSLIR